MNHFHLVSSLILSLAISAGAWAGTVYKWKDKDGVVHYSQRAPQGENVETISTKTPRAPLPDLETPEARSAADKNKSSTDTAAKHEPAKQGPLTVTKDQSTCDMATKAIQDLQQPVVLNNGKVMTIDEKNARLTEMDQIRQVHCP